MAKRAWKITRIYVTLAGACRLLRPVATLPRVKFWALVYRAWNSIWAYIRVHAQTPGEKC